MPEVITSPAEAETETGHLVRSFFKALPHPRPYTHREHRVVNNINITGHPPPRLRPVVDSMVSPILHRLRVLPDQITRSIIVIIITINDAKARRREMTTTTTVNTTPLWVKRLDPSQETALVDRHSRCCNNLLPPSTPSLVSKRSSKACLKVG